jgi:hypothetical protein
MSSNGQQVSKIPEAPAVEPFNQNLNAKSSKNDEQVADPNTLLDALVSSNSTDFDN